MKPGEYTIKYGKKGGAAATVSGKLDNGLKSVDAVTFSSGDGTLTAGTTKECLFEIYNFNAVRSPLVCVTDSEYLNWKGVTWTAGNSGEAIIADDVEDLKDLGIGWVRLTAGRKDGIDQELADKMVLAAENAGINVLVRYAKKTAPNIYGTDEEEAEEAAYLTKLVNRYKNVVKHWEIGNEPNLSSNWDESIKSDKELSIKNYIKHLRNSYRAIKAADPEAVVLLGGLSEYNAAEFVNYLGSIELEDGTHAYDWFDEVAFHPYATNDNSNPQQVITTLNENLLTPMKKWPEGKNSKPVWITEIGFHAMSDWSKSACPGYVADEATKAAYLTETMGLLNQALPETRPIMWYNLHEKGTSNGYGLTSKTVDGDSVVKTKLAAYDAMKALKADAEPASSVLADDNFDGLTQAGQYVIPEGWSSNIAVGDMTTTKYVNAEASASSSNTTGILKVYNYANATSASTAEREINIPEGGGIVKISFDLYQCAKLGYAKSIRLLSGATQGVNIVYDYLTGTGNYILLKDPEGTGASDTVALAPETQKWITYEFTVNCSLSETAGMQPGAYTVKIGNNEPVSGQMKNGLTTIDKIRFDPCGSAANAKLYFEIDNFKAELITEAAVSEISEAYKSSGSAVVNVINAPAKKGTLIVAAYNDTEDGSALSRIVYSCPDMLFAKGASELEISLDGAAESETYKVFFLDSINGLMPLSESKGF